jgi:hypothetical protein
MIDDDLLHGLAVARTTVEPRPMSDIIRRARQMRARRRARWAGTAVVALALLGTTTVPVLTNREPVVVTPMTAEQKDCGNYETVDVSLARNPDLAFLPPPGMAPGTTQRPPTASRLVSPCPMPTAPGNWYSAAPDGTVTKRLTVRGPGYPAPDTSTTAGPQPETVDLGGRSGLIEDQVPDGEGASGASGWVWWVEDDGSTWRAEGQGMSRLELLSAVRSLTVAGGRLDTSRLPSGLTDVLPAYTGPTRGSGDVQVDFGFSRGVHSQVPLGSRMGRHLLVTQTRDSSWQAQVGARPVSVNGAVAWIAVQGEADYRQVSLKWQLAPGVVGSFIGDVSITQAVRLAETTAKISLDDPRLQPLP